MPRWLRHLVALLVAFSVAFGAPSAARASGPEIGALDTSHATGPALVVPHDVPVVLGREPIPPVPPSYVTKDLGWLELSYPPSAGERVASIIEEADDFKAELTGYFGQPVLSRVIVRIAPTVADMARLAPPDAPPPEYASGVAYHGMHFVLLSMLAPRGAQAVDLDEVFRHELTHVALEDALQGRHVPAWFNEGLAISLSGELSMARRKTLWNATLSGTLIPLSDLDRTFPRDNFEASIAYAEAADFMQFLTRKSDRLRFASMVERVREGQPFERAIADAYSADLRRLELEWRSDLERRFSVIPVLTGGGILWVAVIGALVAAYVRRRRRTREILERWGREEALEDARLAKLEAERAAALGLPTDVAGAATAARARGAALKIEHHGRWHTLH